MEELKRVKRVFPISENRYNEIKSYLRDRGDQFSIINSGVTEKLLYKDKTYIRVDKSQLTGQGYHLSNIVKRDIKKYLDSGFDYDKRGKDYSEQQFNEDAIEKNIGNLIISIDVNDCYWQTAYNLGYITKKTYEGGLRKKEWKIGRNASIGSLAKIEVITAYDKGSVVKDHLGKPKKTVLNPLEGYQEIRHNIVGYVCDLFKKLSGVLKNDMCMVLTDCVFTTIERRKEVEQFFLDYGYKCKFKCIEFVEFKKNERVVKWIELKNPSKIKYYMYNESQVFKI